jgi:lysophospholipase L1-like esterase
MRARGAAFAVPAMVGGLWVQAQRAAHAPLPQFDDQDLTGYYGGGRSQVRTGPIPRIAVVGDSTFTGPGLESARDIFVAQAAARLRDRVHLTRFAVGGSRIADVLMHQLPAILDARPHIAVMSIGANDAIHSTPLVQFERDFRSVVGALDRAGIETIVCGLIDLSVVPRIPTALKPMLSLRGAAYERRKRRATHQAARAAYVGASRPVNELVRARGEEFFTSDRFHPNGAGHRCLADGLIPHLTAAVRRAHELADSAKLTAWLTPSCTNAPTTSRRSRTTVLTH